MLDDQSGSFSAVTTAPLIERRVFAEHIGGRLQRNDNQCEPVDLRTEPILNIHGTIGSGKTALVQQLYVRFAIEHPVIWLDCGAMHADRQPPPETWTPLLDLLRPLVPGITLPPVQTALQIEQPAPHMQFARSAQLGQQQFLLLLDAVDNLADWKWLQAQVIKPLVETGVVLVVCTSRAPLFWHFWELRGQCELRELAPFTLEETRQFLHQAGRDLLTQAMYTLTHGYPLGLACAVEHLRRISGEYIAAVTPSVAPDDLSSPARDVLYYTGLVRKLEVPVLRQLLAAFAPDWAGITPVRGQQQLFAVLTELRGAGYLEALRKDSPLRMHPSLRQTAEARLAGADPRLYNQICEQLAAIYHEKVTLKPITEIRALNEWLYFSAAMLPQTPDASLVQAWVRQVRQLFTRVRLAGPQLVAFLYSDGELLRHLQLRHLLDALHQVLQEVFATAVMPFPVLSQAELEALLHNYQGTLLEQLAARLPQSRLARTLQPDFAALLRVMADPGIDFDLRWLQQQLGLDRPGAVHETVAYLYSQGVVSYDRRRRTYRLNPLVRQAALDIEQVLTQLTPPSPDYTLNYSVSS